MASEHGLRTSAGMKLSRFLRDIGDEHAKVQNALDPQTGRPRIITNLEALARKVWEMALGYEETRIVVDANTGRPREVKTVHKPDLACITLIYDRLEGKVAPNAETGKKQRLVSQRVGDQARKRLNALVEGGHGGDNGG